MTSTRGSAGRAGVTPSEFLDDGHRDRLEQLVLQQQAEIAALQATIGRVRALRDLAEWAAKMAGETREVKVSVSDLSRALDGTLEGSPSTESLRR
jgi:hypothetical protein